jgi:hypothetical protein
MCPSQRDVHRRVRSINHRDGAFEHPVADPCYLCA